MNKGDTIVILPHSFTYEGIEINAGRKKTGTFEHLDKYGNVCYRDTDTQQMRAIEPIHVKLWKGKEK